MYFQNIEFYETDKFQYLLIHKNGTSSVLKCIEELNPKLTMQKFNKIKWTVIRDPYERFVAGLKYDLTKHSINIEDIDYTKLFNSYVKVNGRLMGNVNHCSSQVPYLINTDINYYVDIKDLNIFLKMHFNKTIHLNKQNKDINIDLKLDKSEIMKYLNLDYEIYNHIKSSNLLWEWQNGKIF